MDEHQRRGSNPPPPGGKPAPPPGPPSVDFRALCAELVQAWEAGFDVAGPMQRARAILALQRQIEATPLAQQEPVAQFEPEEHDREGEIAAILLAHSYVQPDQPPARVLRETDFGKAARAILARCGRLAAPPGPAGPTNGEGVPCDLIRTLLRPGYEPGDGSADGAQLVSLAWWHPAMGCDSLQIVVDNARAGLARQEGQ